MPTRPLLAVRFIGWLRPRATGVRWRVDHASGHGGTDKHGQPYAGHLSVRILHEPHQPSGIRICRNASRDSQAWTDVSEGAVTES